MIKLNQKGAIQFVILALLLAGIIVGVFLITNGNPLKLFSRATTPPIVFKATGGASLPTNSSGIPTSTSSVVRIELTSPLGSPTSISGPNNRRTVSYKIAENPADINSAAAKPYTSEPTIIDPYSFYVAFDTCSKTQRFIWVEFKGSDGSIDRRTAQIEFLGPCPSVSAPIASPDFCSQFATGSICGQTSYENCTFTCINGQAAYNCQPNDPEGAKVCTGTIFGTIFCTSEDSKCSSGTPSPIPSNVGIGRTSGGSSGGIGGGGGGGGGQPPVTRFISQVRFAESPIEFKNDWQNYYTGMVLSHTFTNSSPGTKSIFIQFRDDQQQIVKINGQDYIQSSIELEEERKETPVPPAPVAPSEQVVVGTAALSSASTVFGSGGSWNPVPINVSLSGFSTPGRSIVGLFVRNQAGQCSINDCGYIGWTQIRSYGTNGTDSTPWTAPSSLSPGVHMFGVFSLNADGTAGQLLDVSATNFSAASTTQPAPPPAQVAPPPASGNNCVANVTTCSCSDPDPSSSRYPGKCYPECNGGWCNGGICSTCKP